MDNSKVISVQTDTHTHIFITYDLNVLSYAKKKLKLPETPKRKMCCTEPLKADFTLKMPQ